MNWLKRMVCDYCYASYYAPESGQYTAIWFADHTRCEVHTLCYECKSQHEREQHEIDQRN